jgi:hypothetical protein
VLSHAASDSSIVLSCEIWGDHSGTARDSNVPERDVISSDKYCGCSASTAFLAHRKRASTGTPWQLRCSGTRWRNTIYLPTFQTAFIFKVKRSKTPIRLFNSAPRLFETWASICHPTRRNTPEDLNLHFKFKFFKMFLLCNHSRPEPKTKRPTTIILEWISAWKSRIH